MRISRSEGVSRRPRKVGSFHDGVVVVAPAAAAATTGIDGVDGATKWRHVFIALAGTQVVRNTPVWMIDDDMP